MQDTFTKLSRKKEDDKMPNEVESDMDIKGLGI